MRFGSRPRFPTQTVRWESTARDGRGGRGRSARGSPARRNRVVSPLPRSTTWEESAIGKALPLSCQERGGRRVGRGRWVDQGRGRHGDPRPPRPSLNVRVRSARRRFSRTSDRRTTDLRRRGTRPFRCRTQHARRGPCLGARARVARVRGAVECCQVPTAARKLIAVGTARRPRASPACAVGPLSRDPQHARPMIEEPEQHGQRRRAEGLLHRSAHRENLPPSSSH